MIDNWCNSPKIKLRILLVLGRYLPDKNGGIENYSHLLSSLLLKSGHSVEIGILESPAPESYFFDDIKINTLNGSFEKFKGLLQGSQYEICHFQEYSAFGGIEMFWLQAAKQYCKRVFFTFHLPYFTCYKNDFRYFGIENCNEFSSPDRCVKCVIATRLKCKMKSPELLVNAGIQIGLPIFVKTHKAKKLREAIQLNTGHLDELVIICDKIFLIADWFKTIIRVNGYASPHFKLIPPIVEPAFFTPQKVQMPLKYKLLFVGRIEQQKGLLLLCKALKISKRKSIRLEVVGNKVDEKYFLECQKEFAFTYNGTVQREILLTKFREYDFLVLPSVFTEMYSMVLQEALTALVPVIASTAKGNVDAIDDGKNGFLFKYGDHKDLERVIDKAYNLLENKWVPKFRELNDYVNDLEEILSYYE